MAHSWNSGQKGSPESSVRNKPFIEALGSLKRTILGTLVPLKGPPHSSDLLLLPEYSLFLGASEMPPVNITNFSLKFKRFWFFDKISLSFSPKPRRSIPGHDNVGTVKYFQKSLEPTTWNPWHNYYLNGCMKELIVRYQESMVGSVRLTLLSRALAKVWLMQALNNNMMANTP